MADRYHLGLTYEDLRTLKPCADSLARVTKLLGGARKWKNKKITARGARDAGVCFADVIWAAFAVAKNYPEVARRLQLWRADCAAHVLPIYEKDYPADLRPREAILAARRFAHGKIDVAAQAAARAAALVAAQAGTDAEQNWQFDRLVLWLSEKEPEDWPLPTI